MGERSLTKRTGARLRALHRAAERGDREGTSGSRHPARPGVQVTTCRDEAHDSAGHSVITGPAPATLTPGPCQLRIPVLATNTTIASDTLIPQGPRHNKPTA